MVLKIGCCGSGDWLDYDRRHLPMPNECRDPDTGNQWDLGCDEQFSHWLEARIGWMAGLALFLVVEQVSSLVKPS